MDVTSVANEIDQKPDQRLVLKLFIVGGRPESSMVVDRLRTILKEHGFADSSLQVFDIEQTPQIARDAQVVGVPTLVREFPLPRKIVVGDLSQAASVLGSLALPVSPSRQSRVEAQLPQLPSAVLPPFMGYPGQKTVRVLLVGFNLIVRSGLREMLTHSPWIEMVPEAVDEDQTLQSLRKAAGEGWPIHIVLTDKVQPTRYIKSQFPETAVLVLTEHSDPATVIEMIAAGGAGCISLQDLSTSEMLEAIRGAVAGKVQVKTAVLSEAVNSVGHSDWRTANEHLFAPEHLSAREVEVLRLLGNGDSNRDIAESLGITLDTTKKHVRSIIKKLLARNRTHAAIIALRIMASRPGGAGG